MVTKETFSFLSASDTWILSMTVPPKWELERLSEWCVNRNHKNSLCLIRWQPFSFLLESSSWPSLRSQRSLKSFSLCSHQSLVYLRCGDIIYQLLPSSDGNIFCSFTSSNQIMFFIDGASHTHDKPSPLIEFLPL